MLSYVLQSAGYRVGLYTSPHMHHLGERIAVNNSPLDPDKLDALVESHKSTLKTQQEKEGGALTHFEVMTALAFRWVTFFCTLHLYLCSRPTRGGCRRTLHICLLPLHTLPNGYIVHSKRLGVHVCCLQALC